MTDEFVNASDLIGPALDWAVATCEGFSVGVFTVDEQWARFIEGATVEELEKHAEEYAGIKAGLKPELCKVHVDGYRSALDARAWRFDEDWSKGGPIIEREGINFFRHNKLDALAPWVWCAHKVVSRPNMEGGVNMVALAIDGPTPLVAAMRCYVASKLGDKINVPKELIK